MFHIGELQEYLNSRNKTNKLTRTKYVLSHIIKNQLVNYSANIIRVALQDKLLNCINGTNEPYMDSSLTTGDSADTIWQLNEFLMLL